MHLLIRPRLLQKHKKQKRLGWFYAKTFYGNFGWRAKIGIDCDSSLLHGTSSGSSLDVIRGASFETNARPNRKKKSKKIVRRVFHMQVRNDTLVDEKKECVL